MQDVLPDGALAHGGDEVLGDLEVDVGLEQRATHLAHGVVDVLLGQPPLAPQPGKRFVEAIGQRFKHIDPCYLQVTGSLRDARIHGTLLV